MLAYELVADINIDDVLVGSYSNPEIIWDTDEVRLATEIEYQRYNNYVEYIALKNEYEELYGPYTQD